MNEMPNVEILNVSKRYGNIVALDNVSLKINDKEYVCIIGPSGSGKSTLLKIIAGIIKPTEGSVIIDGVRVDDIPLSERGIGVVMQDILLFPNMNVRDNVSFPPLVKGLDYGTVKSIVSEIIRDLSLVTLAERYPDELSRGSQQKVAIARAVASGARLILMDEPMGSLDTRSSRILRYELRSLIKDLGLTAIHVTHNQEEAMSVADRMVILRRGKVMQVGTPEEIYFNPKSLFIARFVGGEVNAFEGIVEEVSGDKATVYVKGLGRFEGKIMEGVSKGDKVGIAVRPEDVIVTESHETEIKGCVKSLTYYGFCYEIDLKIGNHILKVKVPRRRWFSPDIGDEYYIDIIRAYVYRYPEEGLERAIAYE